MANWYIKSAETGYKSDLFSGIEYYAYDVAKDYAREHPYETITLWTDDPNEDWCIKCIANKERDVFEYLW